MVRKSRLSRRWKTWIKLLLDADGKHLQRRPAGRPKLPVHKTIEARAQGKAAGISGFVRKEYTRWNNILNLQQTTFQGAEGGALRNVVPYAFYINTNDLNDMFLNKAQMGWYDHLGYTLDGSEDLRDAIYADFTTHLREKVAALKDAVQAIADSVNKDIWR